MHTEAIAGGVGKAEEARDQARLVAQQLDRMMLRLARLQEFAHQWPSRREVVDIGTIARQMAELVVPLAAKRGVIVRMAPLGRFEVEADALQIEQVVTNLLLNGIQATPAGGEVEITIVEAEEYGDHFVKILVTDDGPGIPPDLRPRVFEPFYTTKQGEGTGLGLAVADAIVRAHEGWIGTGNVEGRGASFQVYLPAKPRP